MSCFLFSLRFTAPVHFGLSDAAMGIEGGTVKLRQRADLLHRNPTDWLFLQQLQKGLLEHHLRIAFPCIQLLHFALLTKSLQNSATLRHDVLLFFQLQGKCRLRQ